MGVAAPWWEGRWWLSSLQKRKSQCSGSRFNRTQPCPLYIRFLALGAQETWATSLVPCRSTKCRPVSESQLVEQDRRYGIGEGPGHWSSSWYL